MKRGLQTALIGAALALAAGSAHAVQSLQLDIGPTRSYDAASQTIVSTSDIFTLYALLDPNWANTLDDSYFISAALVPQTAQPGGDYGTFRFNGTEVRVTADMDYGIPPMEAYFLPDPGDLTSHGIFNTYYTEFGFQFDPSDMTRKYDSRTRALEPGSFYYAAFQVDVSGLMEGYRIHFDLYNTKVGNSYAGDVDIEWKALYSYDAESGRSPVPEPASMMLMGSGLVGLASYGLRRRRKP